MIGQTFAQIVIVQGWAVTFFLTQCANVCSVDNMSISIKDIAEKANVSPSTVSRALQNHPRISEETRENIHALALEMGYVPSEAARALVGKRTATIGVALPEFADPFYMGILSGIEEVALANNYELFVGSYNRDPQRERKLFDAFEEKRLTGLVIAGTQVDDAYLTRRRRSVPAVLVNQPGYPHAVMIDQREGAFQATQHLIQLGHRRIAYIAHPSGSVSEQRRSEGYCRALKESGVEPNPDHTVTGTGDIAGGVRAAQTLLAQDTPPTAIFCYNDRTAIGAIHALHQAGLRVPADVSVVGFDDLDIASYVTPPLTTVRQPNLALGRRAASMLIALLRGETVVPKILHPELVIRQSTGPCRKIIS
jgi:DNA-binding LacI/PurR family transcriptional regulator